MEAIEETNYYDESTCAILSAGERTGTLKEAIHTAVDHIKSSSVNHRLMIGMAMFTTIELCFAVTSLLGNRYGMLPSLEKNLPTDLSEEKLIALRAAIQTGYLLNDIMIYLTALGAIVFVMGFYAYFDQDKRFRTWVDDKVMLIPVLGAAILHGAISSSFKVASSLVKGGAALTVVMDIAEKSTRVPRVIHYWQEAMRRAENGDSVALSLSQPVLDGTDQLLILSHSDRDQLALALQTIAERRRLFAERYARKFGIVSFLLTTAYTVIAVCISLYVVFVQNSSMMSGMSGISG
jgi:type II secretory pathway component PulF